jgi:hypothetical protein
MIQKEVGKIKSVCIGVKTYVIKIRESEEGNTDLLPFSG